ncbi:MAG: L,D-transpeptidase [Gemmatimonadaceae bacterium]
MILDSTAGAVMKQERIKILAGIMLLGALGAESARAQQIDTLRVVVDTTRKVDTLRVVRDSASTADSTKRAVAATKVTTQTSDGDVVATKSNLKMLGTVEGGVRLGANLSTRTLTVVAQNGAIRTFNIAIGTPSYPTPTGTYSIRRIVWNPSWIPPDSKWAKKETAKGPGERGNPMKVAKIFFKEPDYYIHGTAAINSLGSAASHGCLRMHPDEVAELAQFLMMNGGQAKEEGWFSRVVHMRWKTHTVTLSKPVTITVSN